MLETLIRDELCKGHSFIKLKYTQANYRSKFKAHERINVKKKKKDSEITI